jgi:hypothetical protein
MAETKYGDYLVPIPVRTLKGKGNGFQGWDLFGKDLGGFEVNVGFFSHREVGRMNPELQKKPHVHAFDEVLFFMGSDPDDMSKLGVEAEMCMGKEQEKHIITIPTAVVVPHGLPHCPITFLKVDRPCYFWHVALSAERPHLRHGLKIE